MEKINLNKFFGKAKSIFQKKHSKVHRSARTDWRIIIISFFILNLVSFGLNTYMWFRINQGNIFIVPRSPDQTQLVINKKGLNEVLKYFEEKEERIIDAKNQTAVSVDPSL